METCNRDTLKTEGNVKTKVETGVMQLQAKEHQGLPAATGSQGEKHGPDSPSGPPEGTNPADTSILDLRPSESGENKCL